MSSVGQAVGGVVGAVVGFVASGGNPAGALYGAQIGLAAGGLLDPPKGPAIQGPRLNDLAVQTSTYGAVIPRAYGTVATHGNVIWLKGDSLTEVARKSSQGGKGGAPKSQVTEYSYFATFAVGLCRGPIDGVRRIWVGPNLIYDASSVTLEGALATNEAGANLTIYLGTETQLPDPDIQADRGIADTPAYTGLAYIVFRDFPLADYGNTLQAAQVKAEIVTSGAVITLPLLADQTHPYAPYTVTGGIGGGTGVPYSGHAFFCDIDHSRFYLPDWDNSTPPNPRRFFVYDLRPNALTFQGTREVNRVANQTPPRFCTDSLDAYYGSINEVFSPPPSGTTLPTFQQGRQVNGRVAVLSRGATTRLDVAVIGSPAGVRTVFSGVTDQGAVALSSDGDIYFIRPGGIDVYDWDTLSLINTVAFSFALLGQPVQQARAVIAESSLWLNTGTDATSELYRIALDLSNIELLGTLPTFSIPGGGDSSRDIAIRDGVFARIAVSTTTTSIRAQWFSITAFDPDATVPLADIVEAECLQSSILAAPDLDLSELTQNVRGYKVGTVAALRAAIDPLQGAFPFDLIQSGYQLAARTRGRASVASITAAELDSRPGDDGPGQKLVVVREMDTQLPRRVGITYLDNGREYDISQQSSDRISTDSVHTRILELPLVLTADEAAQRSEVLLYLYWLERYDLQFRLPPDYLALEPADVITLTVPGAVYEARLTSVEYGADQRLMCHAKLSNAATYVSTATGEQGDSEEQVVSLAGPSEYLIADGPTLRDDLDAPGVIGAMTGFTAGWPGGLIMQTFSAGSSWQTLQSFTGIVPFGFAGTTIAAPDRFDSIDEEHQLRVFLNSGTLASVTELELLGGANRFFYGSDGRWELIGARDAVLQGDGTWLLSGLLRGQRGSEWAASLHAVGDGIMYLNDSDVAFMGQALANVGVLSQTRGITVGAAIDSDDDRDFTYGAENLKPLSPVYLNGNRHPSTGDWTLTWVRRTRIDVEWRDLVDAGLGETTEAYEIEVYATAGFSTVLRTLTATSATVAYTSAQQVADFGSNQGTLHVRVYQISSRVGRGRPLTESITRG